MHGGKKGICSVFRFPLNACDVQCMLGLMTSRSVSWVFPWLTSPRKRSVWVFLWVLVIICLTKGAEWDAGKQCCRPLGDSEDGGGDQTGRISRGVTKLREG